MRLGNGGDLFDIGFGCGGEAGASIGAVDRARRRTISRPIDCG